MWKEFYSHESQASFQENKDDVYEPTGKHILMDFRSCNNKSLLKDALKLEKIIEESISHTNAKIVRTMAYLIGEGYTTIAVITESHFAIHTYPEYDAAFIDVFTCGNTHPEYMIEPLLNTFEPLEGVVSLKYRFLERRFFNDIDEVYNVDHVVKLLQSYVSSPEKLIITKYDEDEFRLEFER